MIEIHGDGGRGVDWTNGCIALTDQDIDQLYGKVKTGIPVYIIGSVIPLKEILLNK